MPLNMQACTDYKESVLRLAHLARKETLFSQVASEVNSLYISNFGFHVISLTFYLSGTIDAYLHY